MSDLNDCGPEQLFYRSPNSKYPVLGIQSHVGALKATRLQQARATTALNHPGCGLRTFNHVLVASVNRRLPVMTCLL